MGEYNRKAQMRFDSETRDMNAFAKFFQSILFHTCQKGSAPRDGEAVILAEDCKRVLREAERFRDDLTSGMLQVATQTKLCAKSTGLRNWPWSQVRHKLHCRLL